MSRSPLLDELKRESSIGVTAKSAAQTESSRRTNLADNQASESTGVGPVVMPVHFAWTRYKSAMLLHPSGLDKSQLQFVRDVLHAVSWRLPESEASASRFTAGEFKWPQLENSTGTPERALGTWFKKHLAETQWVGIDQAVATQYTSWPEATHAQHIIVLNEFFSSMVQSDTKRSLWLKSLN